MKVVVTSGGTREYIDDVRVITNTSSGRLGAMIADEAPGHMPRWSKDSIVYIHGKHAVLPCLPVTLVPIVTCADAMEAMREHVPGADVVIHPLAVSDFTFKRDGPVKVSGEDSDAFIEYMRRTIVPNPKILGMIRKWNQDCFLVSFKFLSGKTHTDLIETASRSMKDSGSDLVVANDLQEMKRSGNHVAWLVDKHGARMCSGKNLIAQEIWGCVESWMSVRKGKGSSS